MAAGSSGSRGSGPTEEEEKRRQQGGGGEGEGGETELRRRAMGRPGAPLVPETLGPSDLDPGPVVRAAAAVDPDPGPSLGHFLCAELTRGYYLENDEAKFTERRERVYSCMRIPKELEKMMAFGNLLCLDAFLYVFTLLPVRVILALLRLLTLPCRGARTHTCPYCRRSSVSEGLQPSQVCDVLKGLILLLCLSMMHCVDYAMMYHVIRGQSVIKLYLIYSMTEVGDRLFSSFGQDILDSLYWTATEPKERKRDGLGVLAHFLMAVCSIFLHTLLIMVQALAINVAFNSHNKSLLTIMLSNNFLELKTNVFRKFGKNNLFQMSTSDIKERFTSYIILLVVCLRNMEQFSWNPEHLWVLCPNVALVVLAEVTVDLIKHTFITKFNDITADVYSEYRANLAVELVSSRQKNAHTDHSDMVARRMGFIPLPLAILLIRVVSSSLKVQGVLAYSCVFLCYLGLASFKVLNSIVLLGKSCIYVRRANMEDQLFQPPPPPSQAEEGTSPAPTGVEETPDTSCTATSSSSSSSSSVTTQPSPRTDFLPTPPSSSSTSSSTSTSTTSSSTSSTSTCVLPPTSTTTPSLSPAPPSRSPLEPETLSPGPGSQEAEPEPEPEPEAGEEEDEDLLEVDRFTIIGNCIN